MEYKPKTSKRNTFWNLIHLLYLEAFLSVLENSLEQKNFPNIIYKKLLINFTKVDQCCVLVVNLEDLKWSGQ